MNKQTLIVRDGTAQAEDIIVGRDVVSMTHTFDITELTDPAISVRQIVSISEDGGETWRQAGETIYRGGNHEGKVSGWSHGDRQEGIFSLDGGVTWHSMIGRAQAEYAEIAKHPNLKRGRRVRPYINPIIRKRYIIEGPVKSLTVTSEWQ